MHRPSNVDEREAFENILTAVGRVARSLPIVFPIHPRTRGTIDKLGLSVDEGIHCVEPLGYLDFLALMKQARLVLTDSGGMQEETSVLGIPCVTIRKNTERPITCTLGTNRIAGVDPEAIVSLSLAALDTVWRPAQIPLWDGQTGSRIADILSRDLASEHEKTVMELA
jgi:UDP-N-acetylglucosamine 2-epimerase (non-hydrolysing)